PVVVYAVAWDDGSSSPSWSSAWPFVIVGVPPLVVAVNAWMVERTHLRGRPTPPPAPSASSAGGAAVVDVRLTPVGARHRNPWVVLDGRLTARVHHDRPVRLRVAPGVHELRASADWVDSPTVWVELWDGDVVSALVGDAGGGRYGEWRHPWQALTLVVEPRARDTGA
ncbi:MAG TPA: hypothetical protein VE781_00345, partial [Kineosporiaceae bacterium]|nr:hypothetical protein [Kineosporiaceae bacterium]